MKMVYGADNSFMNNISCRLLVAACVFLSGYTDATRAGLIELIETDAAGQLILSIEGNALRLTDVAGGTEPLRVFSTPGSGASTAEDLGFAGEWFALTVLGQPLQSDPLLPTTRLDSLLDGAGLSSSGNPFNEITVIDSTGGAYTFDIDLVEVIGGVVPEPSAIIFVVSTSMFLVRWRI